LVREKKLPGAVFAFGESQMINRHILEHHIDLVETNLVITLDQNGHVKGYCATREKPFCGVGLTAGSFSKYRLV
jgi:hypothetical protein